MLLLGCVFYTYISVVYVFVMHSSVYMFVMHALLWSWLLCIRSWYAVGIVIHDVSILMCHYDYTCIMLIWLILQTKYPPLNYTEVCWLCLYFGLVDMIYLEDGEDQLRLEKWWITVHKILPIDQMRNMVVSTLLT